MGKFYKFVEKLLTKKTTIFGQEFYYATFIAMIVFFCLSILNIFSFIFALIDGSFYLAIMRMFLFCWSTGFLYYSWLLNEMNLILSKHKT